MNQWRQPEPGDKKSAFVTDLLHFCEHKTPLLHALNSLFWNVGLRDNKSTQMLQRSLTLLSWCYANQNTHPSPRLYLALPPQQFPQNSKRSRHLCGIGREVMWGSHFRKNWEGRGVSFKWNSERLPPGGKEPVIFLGVGGWDCTKAHQVAHLTSFLSPHALDALLPTLALGRGHQIQVCSLFYSSSSS